MHYLRTWTFGSYSPLQFLTGNQQHWQLLQAYATAAGLVPPWFSRLLPHRETGHEEAASSGPEKNGLPRISSAYRPCLFAPLSLKKQARNTIEHFHLRLNSKSAPQNLSFGHVWSGDRLPAPSHAVQGGQDRDDEAGDCVVAEVGQLIIRQLGASPTETEQKRSMQK